MNEDQENDMIQRWVRDTPEEDLKPEDYQHIKTLGSACLTEGNSAQLLTFIQDEKNQGIVKSMGFVLIEPLVNEVVKKEKSLEHCQAAITHLTRVSKLFINHIMRHFFVSSLSSGMTFLLQLDDRKAACVGLVLSALQKQLTRLPVPYTKQLEEADEYGLCRCCTALADFTKSFVQEIKSKNGNYVGTTEDEELRTELLKFCMRSLRELLLDAELSRDRKSSLWLFATEIMVTLPAIQQSLSELLFFNSLKKSIQMDDCQSKESRACLAYLLFVQLITIESFPAVFSPVFVLQCNMEYINQLLSRYAESHLLKGLALYAKSLESVEDNSLPVSLLELQSFYNVPQNLRHILTDCPMQHLRASGLQVFQLFINKLDSEAKHKFFRCMLKTRNHAGVEGYIIKNIKNQVEFSMKPGNASKWFLGVEFLSLLGLVLHLSQGAETDLLNSMDRIMESLNLLRYLLIRDKELRSRTGVWEELCRIKDDYLKMLRVCISLSRAYYSAELKALKDNQKIKAKDQQTDCVLCRYVSQVLHSALVTFDLMESLIVRIEELTEEKLKIPN
uniref:Uncharacterized protein n=1 Tax=Anabas testudineus TaxID=64144 RepID=A0A3Q1JDZ1_ANATE